MTEKTSNKEENWYAIYTRPRAEKKVYKILSENGYNCYLPLVTTLRQWSDRKKKVQLPLISSYVFVNINKHELNNILPFNGVVQILKHLGKPAIIKDYEIENLKILLLDSNNSNDINFLENINLKKGDSVLVDKGVFKGLIAECVEFNGKHRVIVRVEGIQNVIEVNIPLSYIKKMNT